MRNQRPKTYFKMIQFIDLLHNNIDFELEKTKIISYFEFFSSILHSITISTNIKIQA